jgi:hypothetical protein
MPKFAKGKSRPAGSGRRKGTPNRNSERARRLIAEGDDGKIVAKVVADAKAGDAEARRLYFRHLRPPAPKSEQFVGPIPYIVPTTVEMARATILELGSRLAKRDISIEVHDALVNGLKAYLGDKAAEQQRRLDELEDALRNGETESLNLSST